MKAAGEIFAGAKIYAGLPADGRIDRGKQSRRHLYITYTAKIRRRGKAREIACDSSA